MRVLEVTRSAQEDELARIAGLARGRGIARGDAHRDGVVLVTVEHELRDAERKPLARRCELVALGVLLGIAQQRARRLGRRTELRREAEIDHARL